LSREGNTEQFTEIYISYAKSIDKLTHTNIDNIALELNDFKQGLNKIMSQLCRSLPQVCTTEILKTEQTKAKHFKCLL
jgi:hypothetical protein